MLSPEELRRVAEIMRERIPRPVPIDLIGVYGMREAQHVFIDALEQLADEHERENAPLGHDDRYMDAQASPDKEATDD